jgi:hypothetical protein
MRWRQLCNTSLNDIERNKIKSKSLDLVVPIKLFTKNKIQETQKYYEIRVCNRRDHCTLCVLFVKLFLVLLIKKRSRNFGKRRGEEDMSFNQNNNKQKKHLDVPDFIFIDSSFYNMEHINSCEMMSYRATFF